jgi:hypothetical protein
MDCCFRDNLLARPDYFCGGDGLAGVALGVVGAVDEEAADGGGKGFASYGSGLFEVGVDEGLKAAHGVVDSLSKFCEELGVRGAGIEFRFEGG